MVLRPEAVRQRLLKLEQAISRLEELGRSDRTLLRTNFREAWAAERGLQLAAEILSSHNWPRTPSSTNNCAHA